MPLFKKSCNQKVRFKERKEEGERVQAGDGGKRKRGASLDPKQGNFNTEDQDIKDSTTNSCKRFCLEGRAWLARVNAGEGTSRQGSSNNVEFVVEYEGENSYEIEDMVDSKETHNSEGGMGRQRTVVQIRMTTGRITRVIRGLMMIRLGNLLMGR